MKICIDAGHGGKSPGAVGKSSMEKNITLQLALKLRDELVKSEIEVIMVRADDSYYDLQQRCDIANKNKCDYFISIHCNSFSDPSASGTETFYYKGSKEGEELATAIQNAAIKYNKNKNRGVKTADFYVIKYTDMPAVLLEAAFISNEQEEKMLNNENWQNGFTKAVADAIRSYLGISFEVEEISYKVYKDGVQIGAFKQRENAMRTAEQLAALIITGSVKVVSTTGEVLMDVKKPGENPPVDSQKHVISDLRHATVGQMEAFVHKVNPTAPYLAALYIGIGIEEGIRGDIAFAQAIKETNYFRFTGSVKPDQNNFAGIGSTGPGVAGASFLTPEEGIRAQIQHLKAYANNEPLMTKLVDPRFNLVKRGTSPNWEDLNGKWAVPGIGYGESIINIWKRILEEKLG